MPLVKFTAELGSSDRGEIAVTAGAAETETDTVSVNIDVTNAGKQEICALLEQIKGKILAEDFPPATS